MQEETESNRIYGKVEGRMLSMPFFGLKDMNRLEKHIRKVVLGLLLIILVSFNLSPIMSYAADDKIELSVVTDKSGYTSGDVVDADIKITNYNDSFSGTITTMVIELTYDENLLEVDMSSMKKIADDNGGMGFDHIAAKDGKITYQYLNVSDPLKKGSDDLFSLKFKVKGSIDNPEELKNALKVSNAVIQNGQKAKSEKYDVNISYSVNTTVNNITDDDSIGEKVYNESGDLLTEDEQKQIKESASANNGSQNNVDNKGDSDKTEESSVNGKTDSDTSVNASVSSKDGSVSTSGDNKGNNSSDVKNNKTKKVNVVAIAVVVIIVAAIAGGAAYIVIKRRKTENKNEEK